MSEVRGRSWEDPMPEGQWPRGPPSEVRGSGLECQAAMAQERPRRATQVRGQGRQLRGATRHLRSGAEAERSYPESEVRGGSPGELKHAPTPKTRGGGQEELPHV